VTKPNPENSKNSSSKCAYDCTASVHNTSRNSSDSLPSYLQTNIIAQMLSTGGEGTQEEGLKGHGSVYVSFFYTVMFCAFLKCDENAFTSICVY